MEKTAEKAWTLKRSARTSRVWVTVRRDGAVVVTIERFVREKADWISRTAARVRRHKDDVYLPRTRASYLANKERARELVAALLEKHATSLGTARFGRVFIKDLRRNWGSCSELGNLNFNYKLVLIPGALAEYVVVHELCHLTEFNHSRHFWTLVESALPDAKRRQKALRRYHA
jgi:predicted metal-dependent hydrolase